ncbi:hypothetical protein JTM56_34065, partial [Pseudomonas aeruginosa]|nr:hypothetical protein [Pseudomonas aeruginosa]
GAHKGEVKPDSDASTWEFRLTNSARDNYGKACDDQQESDNLFVDKIVLQRLLPCVLSCPATFHLARIIFQNKIFIFHFAIHLTLLNLSK